jgi:hypothetical protein
MGHGKVFARVICMAGGFDTLLKLPKINNQLVSSLTVFT